MGVTFNKSSSHTYINDRTHQTLEVFQFVSLDNTAIGVIDCFYRIHQLYLLLNPDSGKKVITRKHVGSILRQYS